MKNDFTRIAIVLDRSGSMSIVRESTISGFNEFIRQQKAQPGHATVKLVQFDTMGTQPMIETVFDCDLKSVPELTRASFQPRGGTPLLDAQGQTIVQLGEELAAMREEDRPGKVIVMTLTDGEENSSKDWTLDRLGKLIEQQRNLFNWEFIFLGANQDAIKVAATMNIPARGAMSYSSNAAGMANTMFAVSGYVGRSRKMAAMGVRGQSINMFTEDERKSALVPDKP